MPRKKQGTVKAYTGKTKPSRKQQMSIALSKRWQKGKESADRPVAGQSDEPSEPVPSTSRSDEPSPPTHDPEPSTSASSSEPTRSASRSKLERFREESAAPSVGDQMWTLREVGLLNELISVALCPKCFNNSLSVDLGTSLGFSRKMILSCDQCGELNNCFSSPRIQKKEKNIVFVGKQRVVAAVSQAVNQFNQGNFHIAEVMRNLNTAANEVTLAILEKEDERRKRKADKAATAAFAKTRRAHRV